MNLTRHETIKLLMGTAALAVVPSTVKAIDIASTGIPFALV